MTQVRTLPDFENPPVVETVLSIEFAPLARWTVVHFGLFWHEIRTEYPRQEVLPPLATVVERFGEERGMIPAFQIEFVQQPRIRCWFHDSTETRLLQLQADRFIHNWRKQKTPEAYPHYETIWPLFEKEWLRFGAFIAREQIGPPHVTQCEVTYVNQIERGDGWTSLADVDQVVTFLGKGIPDCAQTAESVATHLTYTVPNFRARLHVDLQHAFRNTDQKEVLQLSLTARGQPESGSIEDLQAWMDKAREVVVLAFVDVTTSRMHKHWGRRG